MEQLLGVFIGIGLSATCGFRIFVPLLGMSIAHHAGALSFAQGFGANPDAFLVGCLLPALHLGEKRIFMDQAVCPFLKEGVNVAMNILSHWTGSGPKGPRYSPIKIEAKTEDNVSIPSPPRAGMVMSGGMDSLAALRLNRLHYPNTHPGYVKDSFFLHGFDIGGVVERGKIDIAPEVLAQAGRIVSRRNRHAKRDLFDRGALPPRDRIWRRDGPIPIVR